MADVKDGLGYQFYDIDESGDESNEQKKWKTIIFNYGYRFTDELDLVLAEAVRTGYFIEDKVRSAASKKNQQVITSKSNDSFHDSWDLYHNTFDNNQENVVLSIYNSFKNNVQYMNPSDLNGSVKFFRNFGESEKATDLIDFYVSLRSNENDFFNPKRENFHYEAVDKEIAAKFQETYFKSAKTENAKQVLERIGEKDSWNLEDEVVLANTSVDEFYNLFKYVNGPHLSSYVRKCLEVGSISGSDNERGIQITKNTEEALKKIAQESKINLIRVTKKYGIKIEEV